MACSIPPSYMILHVNAGLGFLSQLQHFRSLLGFQMRQVRQEGELAPAEDEALSHADSIFSDAAELIDLLIWFGAEIPNAKAACIRRTM